MRLVRQPSKTEASSAVPTTEPMLENHATGKLQAAGGYGVLLEHVDEEEERSIFCPWSSVRSVSLAGQVGV